MTKASLVVVAAVLTTGTTAAAQRPDLASISIEDLMKVPITSASRKEQRVEDVAAAVFVLTHEDIRRSGVTTLPDALRQVPGVQVAEINANKWAVSIRGFNGLYANKLLVLIDGRVVYNRLYSGVLWDTEDIVLDDVDRIEVVRGPGGAMWGTNAVNGIINIVTKSAADTPGALVHGQVGTFESGKGIVRYGGAAGSTRYRLYSQWSSRSESDPGADTKDGEARALSAGGRLDWSSGRNAFMLTGSGATGQDHPLWLTPSLAPENASDIIRGTSDHTNESLLGRWTWSRDSHTSLQLQSSFDAARRLEPIGNYHHTAADVDVQYHARTDGPHDLLFGATYRALDESLAGSHGISLDPPRSTESTFSAFAQDDVALARDRLTVGLGARLEHDTGIGWGLQPTARLMWIIEPGRQHAWAAVSQALRSPSLQDRGVHVDFAPLVMPGAPPIISTLHGNPDLQAETATSTEGGYRISAGSLSVDVAGFASRYDGLRTTEYGTPHVEFGAAGPLVRVPLEFSNLLGARTLGLELAAQWQVTSAWRLSGSSTTFRLTPHPDQATSDPAAAAEDGNAPRHQWLAQSRLTLRRTELDVLVARVGALRTLDVPAYTRADVRVEQPLGRGLSAVLAAHNLLDRSHLEYSPLGMIQMTTAVPRSVSLHLVWSRQ